MAKKTSTKSTKKNVENKDEQPTKNANEIKNAGEMSVDELTNMFIQNDTKTIERLKDENTPDPVIANIEQPKTEPDKENTLEKILSEVVAEQPKEETKQETSENKKPEIKKQEPEQPKEVQKPQPSNTNRSVYGYDHFGIIYGY